MLSEEFKPL